ncbi:hypothetical protein GCM10023320_65020 [Pseudonocardia adelaidensis]|uniref:Uncharacterized protein n=1 Tax=Pseudonocardia adelaidensis TaxID=648754 RepID=A0ABP9NWM0_9PSEU
MLAVAVLVTVLGATGCAGPVFENDSCVQPDGGEDFRSADCTEPGALRVLDVRSQSEFCRDIPAVTTVYQDWDDSHKYCLGPPDADPTTAINTAQLGDCAYTEGDGRSHVRVDCADPAAQLQVLHRVEGYAVALNECASVPGTTVEYEWRLDGKGGLAQLSLDNIYFCFGPAGVDPQTFVELARPGDCIAETGATPEWVIVGCSAPEVAYRVHGRADGWAAAVTACQDTPAATMRLMENGRGPMQEPFTLCLGPL